VSAMQRTFISTISTIAILLFLAHAALAQQQHTITTVAGGIPNHVPAIQAAVSTPGAVAKDSIGNLYTADASRSVVYKIDLSGQLSIVAGNGTSGFSGDGGPATSAQLNFPQSVFVDGSGNIFITDSSNQRIRKVAAATGNIQTVAGNGSIGFSGDGGPAASAALNNPSDVHVDSAGNIFIADYDNSRVREVVAATGNIQTVAGNGTYGYSGDGGPATSAQLNGPRSVTVDGSGNVFIADIGNSRIREVVASTGTIQTVAGNGTDGSSGDGGPATSAQLFGPAGVAVDDFGNIFIADQDNNRIREVVAATGSIQTVAGNGNATYGGDGGPATSAALNLPGGVFVDTAGNVIIADTANNRVREVPAATRNIQTVAGNGTISFGGDGGQATSAQLNHPQSVFADGSGNIFITDSSNQRIRKVAAATGNIQTVAGNGSIGFSGNGGPAASAALDNPSDVRVDGAGNIFIADHDNNRVRQVVASTGNIQTVAGNGFGFCDAFCPPLGDGGPATNSSLTPTGLHVDGAGNIFITDNGNSSGYSGVREVIAATGNIQTLARIAQSTISRLGGLSMDGAGNAFIAESGPPDRIYKVVMATGAVQTFVPTGSGTDGLGYPEGVFVDGAGNVFIADTEKNRVLEVDAVTGNMQTVAGNSTAGFSGDGGPATGAELLFPTTVWGDREGNLLIADAGNNRIRRVSNLVAVVGVSVAPGTSTVISGATQQFTASVTNAINTAVTWSLSGTRCSGNTCGTISPQGLYSSPPPRGIPQIVTVTATSVADDTKSATAIVTVPAKRASFVAMSSSPRSPVLGQPVTLTATVTPSSGSGLPTGTVTFQDGTTTLGTASLDSSGSAKFTASSLAVAAHQITATYSGDSGFFASNANLTENVSYCVRSLHYRTRSLNRGATSPIELYLCDASGNDVSSSAVFLHATQMTGPSGFSSVPPGSAEVVNLGSDFRFEAWMGPRGGYIYTLETAGLTPGTYTLQFTAGSDPITHSVSFAVSPIVRFLGSQLGP
jgi:sugar lactone lactonase YvrE